jgi:hypothetical protein
MDASMKPTLFQTVLNFLKAYWIYIAGVVAVIVVWRVFTVKSFNPKTPQDCSQCPGGSGGQR